MPDVEEHAKAEKPPEEKDTEDKWPLFQGYSEQLEKILRNPVSPVEKQRKDLWLGPIRGR